jgi:hypothetical protein
LKEKLSPMEELEFHLSNPTEGLRDNWEMFAKMALLMFYLGVALITTTAR